MGPGRFPSSIAQCFAEGILTYDQVERDELPEFGIAFTHSATLLFWLLMSLITIGKSRPRWGKNARHLLLRGIRSPRLQDSIDDGEELAPYGHDGVHLLLAYSGTPPHIVPIGGHDLDCQDGKHPHHAAHIGVPGMAHARVL